jgi:hypothetical protein
MRFSSEASTFDRALEASVDALLDHVALKLGERAADLKHSL